MYLFGNGLIKCLNCKSNFRGKKQRDQNVYICSLHSRDSSKCVRTVLKEDELSYTVSKHVEIQGRAIDKDLSDYVKSIDVKKDGGYTIFYKDGSKSIIDPNSQDYGIKLKY